MVISDIITEFGAYYLKSGQNASRIYSMLRANTKTTELFTPVMTDETVWRAAQAVQNRILQPFQKAFTAIDGAELKPVAIEMFKMKADSSQYPDDLEASWLGFLAGSGNDRKTWPFVRWYVETVLIPQIKEDEELNEIFWGVYAAPTPGTAGAAGTAMNGINKIIMDLEDANRITPISTGALASDPQDFCEQVEAFADQINAKYASAVMPIAMSEANARKYARGVNAKYGVNTNQFGKDLYAVAGTNLTVVGLPSMLGSNAMWATPKSNAVKLMKRTENINNFNVENVDRQVKFYTDYSAGVGFIIPEAVFINDLFAEQGS